jgi:hypothetical protein
MQETNEIKAAKLLTVWRRDTRPTVSVTKKEYDELLHKVPRKFVSVQKGTGEVLYVTLDKEQAISHLKAEYNLYEASSLCQNNTSKS